MSAPSWLLPLLWPGRSRSAPSQASPATRLLSGPVGTAIAAVAAASAAYSLYVALKHTVLPTEWTFRKKVKRFPGTLPIIGTTLALATQTDTLYDAFADAFEESNNEPITWSMIFQQPHLFINDPVSMEHVFKTHFEKYEKGPTFRGNFHDLLANGIFNSDGEQWKSQRKLASNIFNVKNFKDFVENAFAEKMTDLVAVLDKAADSGQMVTLQRRFIVPLHKLLELVTPSGWQYRRDLAVIREFSHSIISRRLEHATAEESESVKDHDLLGFLVRQRDAAGNPISRDALSTNLINFLFAGRDTTGLTLTWTFLMLARHPSVRDKLVSEIDAATADLAPGATVSYGVVRGLPYANAVMRETLRLYPPVPFNTKQAVANDVLPNGVFVPRGTSLDWGPYALGRSRAIWGDDAREFRPERWMEGGKVPSAFAYNVFNAGPRVCLGKSFAEIEVVFVMVELLRRFSFGVRDVGSGPGGKKTYTVSATLAMEGAVLNQQQQQQQQMELFPGSVPIVGNTVAVVSRVEHLYDIFTDAMEENDNEPLCITFMFEPAQLLINDPVTLEHVFKTHFEKYEKGSKFKSIFHDLLAHGIFNSDGEQWKSQRKLAANIFNVKNFKDFVEHAFAEKMSDLVAIMDAAAESGAMVNLNDLFLRFTMEGFCKIAFGVEIGCLAQKEKPAFAVSFDRCQITFQRRFVVPFHRLLEFVTPSGAEFRSDLAVIRDFSRDIIDRRLAIAAAAGADDADAAKSHDLLGYLMKQRDAAGNPIGRAELSTNLINFLFAGRDTTGLTLTWTFLLLARHPSVLAKLVSEIDAATAGLADAQTVSYDVVRSLSYANAVMHETLRLCPPVAFNSKQAVADDVLPNGLFVPRGTVINWGSYAFARNRRIWGEDAREFRPERWLEMAKVPSAFAYNVFNSGPRICLGKSFAEIEVVFVMVELLRRFRFGVVDVGKGPGGKKTYAVSSLMTMEGGELLATVQRR
ncbi:cytochrome P450 [Zopfochytrium polystomum]|nr:cytochrome P450 [Zopfochytrium polystomum]